jgi:hypothetical protein
MKSAGAKSPPDQLLFGGADSEMKCDRRQPAEHANHNRERKDALAL